ncbi:hypothetical protein [Anaerosporobacter faecicola]|uniref:hypothetical protein n=1 Tax=Anaerosporobacter faecicola TaxID=2718714 RepID=UPI00143C2A69|nr:hypothetical protein [Anaerosporobacter faecicola]
MQKRKVFGCVFLLVAVLMVVSVWKDKNDILAETHRNMKQAEMLANSVGFTLDKKMKVEIDVESKIKEGGATITLQTETGEILYEFATDCEETKVMKLEAGSYEVRTDSDSCKGNFDIVIRKK